MNESRSALSGVTYADLDLRADQGLQQVSTAISLHPTKCICRHPADANHDILLTDGFERFIADCLHT